MLEKLISEFQDALSARPSRDGIEAFNCKKSALVKVALRLRDAYGFEALEDIAAIDNGEDAGQERFGAVYHFYSHSKKCYARIYASCQSADEPSLPSLCSVYKGADWHEREAYDMMGIKFEGHPSLRRILMWESYPWHPLRKDFPLAGRQAPLPPLFEGQMDAAEIVPAPEEGGPFHSPSSGVSAVAQKEPRSAEAQDMEKLDNV